MVDSGNKHPMGMEMDMTAVLVYITASDYAEAEKIGGLLLKANWLPASIS